MKTNFMSVRNDETRICKKYLFAVFFWKAVMSDKQNQKIRTIKFSCFFNWLTILRNQFSQFSLWDEKARIQKIAMDGQPICEKHESVLHCVAYYLSFHMSRYVWQNQLAMLTHVQYHIASAE